MSGNGVVMVVGATSAIGRSLASALASQDHALLLAGRSEEELRRIALDLHARWGVVVEVAPYDARQAGAARSFVAHACEKIEEPLCGLVLCQGSMPDESEARQEAALQEDAIRVNYASSVELIEAVAPHLTATDSGFVIGVTSVAGDRGRPSNALYGSTKAALSAYLSGLRSRLSQDGVRVLNVKPGFVDTRMTWGLSGLFWVASPDRVAKDALRALRKNRAVVYSPGFWRVIMLIIRLLPDPIFRRLQF